MKRKNMEARTLLLFLFFTTALCYSVPNPGNPTGCQNGNSAILGYEVLPGGGWDNLVNENRGQIVRFNYSSCKITEDGKYLIPDGIVTIPVKSSSVKIYSDVIDHWMNYTSSTAKSINVGAKVGLKWIFSIGGKFSTEYQDVKKDQVSDNSYTMRVGARYVRYTAKLQPNAYLDDAFRSRVLSIANHLQSERKTSALYESQLLVRDFGTHVITSVDAGATIEKVDQINRSLTLDSETSKSQISLAASISFFGRGFDSDAAKTVTTQTTTKYLESKTHSTVFTNGGPTYKPVNFSINEWVDGIGNDLVAIDRIGDPLHFIVTSDYFPELPLSAISSTAGMIETAITSYYKFNTIKGCTTPGATNFNYMANVDDGSCSVPGVNLTFGGAYQTCEFSGDTDNICGSLTTQNPKTGAFTCPEGYDAIPLYDGKVKKTGFRQECQSYYVFWKKCHDVPIYGQAAYSTFWCAAHDGSAPPDSGYLYGGAYTSTHENPITKQRNCPTYYHPLRILSDLVLCISDDYIMGERYAAKFGGFHSCQEGNPLANNYITKTNSPKSCPGGYSDHLATIDDECEINYCVVSNYFADVPMVSVKSPPFIPRPFESNTTADYIIANDGSGWTTIFNVEDNFTGFDADVKGWITNDGKNLNIQNLLLKKQGETVNSADGYQNSDNLNTEFGAEPALASVTASSQKDSPKQGLSGAEVATIAVVSVLATLLCVLVASLLVFKIRRSDSSEFEKLT